MSLDACLPDLERKGEIDVGRSKEARELYAELKRYYSRTHDDATASALASQKTIERLEAAVAHKKANTIRMIRAQKDIRLKVRTFNGGDPMDTGPLDPRGAAAILAFDERAGHNDSVWSRFHAIKGRAHAYIAEILADHHRNLIGKVRKLAQLEDVVREIFHPGSTGNENAAELAAAWLKGAEMLRSRFNSAGGQIGKLDYGYLPQSHSWRKVAEAGFPAWRDFIVPLLDRNRMIDRMTGEPMTDAKLELALNEAWEKISSDGWSSVTPGSNSGGKMLANQHADPRFLHFKDGDAWLAYSDKFGTGTPFDAMMGHIESMSRDIALMEILGPNPKATLRWLQDSLKQTANLDRSADRAKAVDRADAGAKNIQRLFDEISGSLRRPESNRMAYAFGTIRALETSAKLGTAIASALPTDPAFGAVTRAFNGLPVWKMFGGYAKMLNPLSAEDRMIAIRSGLIAEEWARGTAAQHRMLNEELTGEVARRLAEGTLRVTGLSAYTQAGRWAFGMEFLGHLTNQVGKRFDELSPALQRSMTRHGIGADQWDIIRRAPLEAHGGAAWLFPQNVEDHRVGDRLLQMIHTETDYAVPAADLRTRAMMNSMAPKGTFWGEVARSALLFKTFGITLLMTHGRRMLERTPLGFAAYAIPFFILTTLGGAAAMELKALVKGEDPEPIPTNKDPLIKHAEFWGKAAVQGGGEGIVGDFIGSTTNRFGGGVGETAAGPLASSAANFGGLAASSVRYALGDKKARPGHDLVNVMKQEMPGSSIWWGRVAFERLVADQLQSEIDPSYRKSWRSMQRRVKQTDQDFWWEPGETSPRRAPRYGKQ